MANITLKNLPLASFPSISVGKMIINFVGSNDFLCIKALQF